jgi:ornithine decarboxylase
MLSSPVLLLPASLQPSLRDELAVPHSCAAASALERVVEEDDSLCCYWRPPSPQSSRPPSPFIEHCSVGGALAGEERWTTSSAARLKAVTSDQLDDALQEAESALFLDSEPQNELTASAETLVRGLCLTSGFEEALINDPDWDSTLPVTEVLELATALESDENSFEEVKKALGAVPIAAAFDVGELKTCAAAFIAEHLVDDTFYLVDVGVVKTLYKGMVEAMPRVRPHYAVKCNPDPGIVSTLAALGAGFDCASKGEVELVISLGISSQRIILANTVKRPCDLCCIAETKVPYTTFDSESELHKIFAAGLQDTVKLVLRFVCDDPTAKHNLGSKFGATMDEVPHLLDVANLLGLDIVGVSFHVGSGCKNPTAYATAICLAKSIFDLQSTTHGKAMTYLDIGGGFTTAPGPFGVPQLLEGTAGTVNEALEKYFPIRAFRHVTVVSEPGRYFAERAATLAVMVHGKRPKRGVEEGFDYYVTDGIYGAFNNMIYDFVTPTAYVMKKFEDPKRSGRNFAEISQSTVFGPTCDSLDVVMHDVFLPNLDSGDWLVFPFFGAYTAAGACNFNGVRAANATTFYCCSPKPTAENGLNPKAAAQRKLYERYNAVQADKPPCHLVHYAAH